MKCYDEEPESVEASAIILLPLQLSQFLEIPSVFKEYFMPKFVEQFLFNRFQSKLPVCVGFRYDIPDCSRVLSVAHITINSAAGLLFLLSCVEFLQRCYSKSYMKSSVG